MDMCNCIKCRHELGAFGTLQITVHASRLMWLARETLFLGGKNIIPQFTII